VESVGKQIGFRGNDLEVVGLPYHCQLSVGEIPNQVLGPSIDDPLIQTLAGHAYQSFASVTWLGYG